MSMSKRRDSVEAGHNRHFAGRPIHRAEDGIACDGGGHGGVEKRKVQQAGPARYDRTILLHSTPSAGPVQKNTWLHEQKGHVRGCTIAGGPDRELLAG